LARLEHFVGRVLPAFGPHEDAMLAGNWHLAHSLLSPALNLGLLRPSEVCDAVEDAYRAGDVPLSSAEGFLRQIIGWREYVWGLYWLWPDHAAANELGYHEPLPPAFTGAAPTELRCLDITVAALGERGWVHHIQRLMVLANLATLVGVEPRHVVEWMAASFVDGSEWVMIPNVVGMGMYADGGRMSTKPYVSGGAYLNRMSDYCRSCRFDPRRRTGDRACPFTTLYWDYLDRHREALAGNHRMVRQLRALDRLSDLGDVRQRALQVRTALRAGRL
jgi:deoxyribodipyrimidine photolyase-related protein